MAAAAAGALAPLAARAGQLLKQVDPATVNSAIEYVRKATGGRVSNLSQVANYASRSKTGLAVVAEGLVRAGVRPNTLFTEDLIKQAGDADIAALSQKLTSEFRNVVRDIDSGSQFRNTTPPEDRARDQLAAENVRYIARKFNVRTSQEIRELHTHVRLFAATDISQLNETLAVRDGWLGNQARF